MKTCTSCGSPLNEEAKFCSRCGAQQIIINTDAVNPEQEQEQAAAQEAAQGSAQAEQNQAEAAQQAQAAYNYSAPYGQAAGGQQNQNTQYGPNQNPYQNGSYQQYNYQYQQYQKPVSPWDHTAQFASEDIAKNKLFAMLVYLGGILGVIVALLAAGREKSDYISFHVRQGIKIYIIELILSIITLALSWTVVFLVAGLVCIAICIVIDVISFVQVCMGKAKEPVIIRRFTFLGK